MPERRVFLYRTGGFACTFRQLQIQLQLQTQLQKKLLTQFSLRRRRVFLSDREGTTFCISRVLADRTPHVQVTRPCWFAVGVRSGHLEGRTKAAGRRSYVRANAARHRARFWKRERPGRKIGGERVRSVGTTTCLENRRFAADPSATTELGLSGFFQRSRMGVARAIVDAADVRRPGCGTRTRTWNRYLRRAVWRLRSSRSSLRVT
jgi:hypothetical protein